MDRKEINKRYTFVRRPAKEPDLKPPDKPILQSLSTAGSRSISEERSFTLAPPPSLPALPSISSPLADPDILNLAGLSLLNERRHPARENQSNYLDNKDQVEPNKSNNPSLPVAPDQAQPFTEEEISSDRGDTPARETLKRIAERRTLRFAEELRDDLVKVLMRIQSVCRYVLDAFLFYFFRRKFSIFMEV